MTGVPSMALRKGRQCEGTPRLANKGLHIGIPHTSPAQLSRSLSWLQTCKAARPSKVDTETCWQDDESTLKDDESALIWHSVESKGDQPCPR